MAVTEQQRHRLLTWFEEHMGPDLGATMMDLMPPADGSGLATKADLAILRSDFAELRAEVQADFAEVRTEFAELRAEVRGDFAELRAEVKEDLLQLQRTFGTWLFTSQAAIIAVVGVVTAVT